MANIIRQSFTSTHPRLGVLNALEASRIHHRFIARDLKNYRKFSTEPLNFYNSFITISKGRIHLPIPVGKYMLMGIPYVTSGNIAAGGKLCRTYVSDDNDQRGYPYRSSGNTVAAANPLYNGPSATWNPRSKGTDTRYQSQEWQQRNSGHLYAYNGTETPNGNDSTFSSHYMHRYPDPTAQSITGGGNYHVGPNESTLSTPTTPNYVQYDHGMKRPDNYHTHYEQRPPAIFPSNQSNPPESIYTQTNRQPHFQQQFGSRDMPQVTTYKPKSAFNVSAPFLSFFNNHAMVMFRPRPPIFERPKDYPSFIMKSDGYLECLFLKRLPYSKKFDKTSRHVLKIPVQQLGSFLLNIEGSFSSYANESSETEFGEAVDSGIKQHGDSTSPISSDVYNASAETVTLNNNVQADNGRNPYAATAMFQNFDSIFNEVVPTLDSAISLQIQAGAVDKGRKVIFSIISNITRNSGEEELSTDASSINRNADGTTNNSYQAGSSNNSSPIRGRSAEFAGYTVALKLNEYKTLQSLIGTLLPSLVGWHVISNPSLVNQYVKDE